MTTDEMIETIRPALERLIQLAWQQGYDKGRNDVIDGEIPSWLK